MTYEELQLHRATIVKEWKENNWGNRWVSMMADRILMRLAPPVNDNGRRCQ